MGSGVHRPVVTRRPRAGDADGEAGEVATTFFLLENPAVVGDTVSLPPEEAHHALRVLRLVRGALVPATDGRGARYRLRLVAAAREERPGARGSSCDAEVLERVEEPAPVPPVEVGLGTGRRERFLWCVEKLTELEAVRIVPLLSATVQGRRALGADAGGRLSGRARARASAALKQSKGVHLPEVAEPMELAEWLAEPFPGLSFLLARPEGAAAGGVAAAEIPDLGVTLLATAREGRSGLERGVRLAIGPEGGFRGDEERALLEAGFVRGHLGTRRLRFETAALAAVCHVRAVWSLMSRGQA